MSLIQCEKPTLAWINEHIVNPETGKPKIIFGTPDRSKCNPLWYDSFREVVIPCGKCVLCLKRRGFEIGIRARCEAKMHDRSCFITLTVNEQCRTLLFPYGRFLHHRPFQLFAKRLRKRVGPFRFLMCGEYGDRSERPHYHAIIFGHYFFDSYFDVRGAWHPSRLLEQLWPFGQVQVAPLNDNRIMYVAGYCLKPGNIQMFGSPVDECVTDRDLKMRSYVRWSRNPGLGATWFDKYWRDVYRYDGKVFRDGEEIPKVISSIVWQRKVVPFASRYFDQRLLLHDERRYAILGACRRDQVGSGFDDLGSLHMQEVSFDIASVGLRTRSELLRKRIASRKRDIT